MPANKYALLRYRIIDECLTNKGRPYPTLDDLREACEERLFGSGADRISRSTIEKDLWAMKNETDLGYEAPIKFSRTHGGYFYEDPNFTIREISLSDEEQEAIRLAATTLYQFRNLGIFDRFGSAIQKIFNRLQLPDDEGVIDRLVQFEHTPMAEGTHLIAPLVEAARDHTEIRFVHSPFNAEKDTVRTLHPYLLKEYRNRWYVIGRDAEKNELKTFGLDRISNLTKTGNFFSPDPSFDPEQLFCHSFGITAGGTPTEVTLRFTQQTANYVRSQPLHPTQKIVDDSAKGLTVTINVIPSHELKAAILSFGKTADVLAPLALRSEIEALR